VSPSPFERYAGADVQALIAEFPLAWVTAAGRPAVASLLPLIGEYDGHGRLVTLLGHCARSNSLHAALVADPRAVLLFRGPQGYVSPEHAGRRDWGPTWNYAQLIVEAEIRFDPDLTEESLDMLTDAIEAGRPAPWRKEELGPRYTGLLAQIIGFRAHVIGAQGRFKLGQDERPETLQSILATHPDPELRRWMERFNPGRF
jgi:transcriptional regulator